MRCLLTVLSNPISPSLCWIRSEERDQPYFLRQDTIGSVGLASGENHLFSQPCPNDLISAVRDWSQRNGFWAQCIPFKDGFILREKKRKRNLQAFEDAFPSFFSTIACKFPFVLLERRQIVLYIGNHKTEKLQQSFPSLFLQMHPILNSNMFFPFPVPSLLPTPPPPYLRNPFVLSSQMFSQISPPEQKTPNLILPPTSNSEIPFPTISTITGKREKLLPSVCLLAQPLLSLSLLWLLFFWNEREREREGGPGKTVPKRESDIKAPRISLFWPICTVCVYLHHLVFFSKERSGMYIQWILPCLWYRKCTSSNASLAWLTFSLFFFCLGRQMN